MLKELVNLFLVQNKKHLDKKQDYLIYTVLS